MTTLWTSWSVGKLLLALLTAGSILLPGFTVTGCRNLSMEPLQRNARADWTSPVAGRDKDGQSDTPLKPPLRLEWTYDVAAGVGPDPPLVIDSVLLFGNYRGELHAVNTRNGNSLGVVRVTDAIPGSPAVHGTQVFVTGAYGKHTFVGYNLGEGKTVWKRSYGDVATSPLLVQRRVYFGNSRGMFSCLELESGELVWSFTLPENKHRKGIRSSAAADSLNVYFGADDGAVYALEAAGGARRWICQTSAPITAGPVVHDGTLYVGNTAGDVYAIATATGAVRWSFNAGTAVYAAARVADDRVMVGTAGGVIFAFDRDTGRPLWHTSLDGVVNARPEISGNLLYAGTLKKELFALNITDGTVAWKQEVSGRIKTQPLAVGGKLYVITDDRSLHAFVGANP